MRVLSQAISVVFHPLLMLTYMLVLLLLVNPYLFGVPHIGAHIQLLAMIFVSTFAIPMIAVVMMKFLGLVESLEMRDKTERIGPYIATGIFYMWMAFYCYKSPIIPTAYAIAMIGTTIALFTAFIINIFYKISIHAVGMGGLVGMTLITMKFFSYDSFTLETANYGTLQISMSLILMIVIVLAGVVGTARMALNAHTPRELYSGYAIGFLTQLIALRFLF